MDAMDFAILGDLTSGLKLQAPNSDESLSMAQSPAFDVGDALRGRLKQGAEQRLLILVSSTPLSLPAMPFHTHPPTTRRPRRRAALGRGCRQARC